MVVNLYVLTLKVEKLKCVAAWLEIILLPVRLRLILFHNSHT